MNLRKTFILALAVLANVMMMQAGEYSPKFFCGVVKADSWTMNNNLEGIYELDLAASGLTKLTDGRDVFQAPLGGAVYEGGLMKGIHFKTVWDDFDQANTYVLYHVQYDMDSWTRTKAVTLGDMDRNYISSCGLAHDPVTGKNYGIFYNFNMSWQVVNRKLATIDFSTDTPTRTILGTASIAMAAIACSDQGTLYGVGMDGWLYAISTANAGDSEVEMLPLGDLGISDISNNPSSMTYDERTGRFYWSVVLNDQKCYLYEVNPTIGSVSATRLMQTPDNSWLVNLCVIAPQAADEAPAAVTDLSAHFDGSSTTGTVTFTAPTTTYEGHPLTGTLAYRVLANGSEVATGSVQTGTQATATVTVPAGEVELAVVVSNEAGDSPEAKLTVYVGPETPRAPTTVTFNYDYGTQQSVVTWTAPATGVHDLPLDAEALTYNVYRMPEGELVGQSLTEPGFAETFAPAQLAPYYYKVEAIHAGIVGGSAESNTAVIGPALEVPYSNNFATAASFELLTVLDNNHDGVSWKWEKSFSGGGRATYYHSTVNDADDWLLTPPIRLKRGATYRISFEANTAVSNDVDYLDVAYGQGLDTEAYTTLFDHLVLNTPVGNTYTKSDIVPPATGVYYFGFHCTSLADYGWLLLKSINISLVADAPQLKGDVNGDGELDIADVNILINIMLGADSANYYDGRALITDDNEVDIADVSALINLMLN